MMIPQPETAGILQSNSVMKIMGMDLTTFVLVCIIILLLGIMAGRLWWDRHKRDKNIKDAKDSVLLEIAPMQGGRVHRVLAKQFQGEAKEHTNEAKETFLISWFAKPEGSNIEPYQLWPGFEYMDVWPLDAPESQQVPVMKWYFLEGDPAPKMPHDEEKYNVERVTRTTTAFSRLGRETAVASTMLGQFSGFFQDLIAALPMLKKINIVFILEIVILVGIAACLYFQFTGNQTLSAFIKGASGK